MRMDDVSGPLDWIHIANEVGIKPWAGVFINDIDTAEAADLASPGQRRPGHRRHPCLQHISTSSTSIIRRAPTGPMT